MRKKTSLIIGLCTILTFLFIWSIPTNAEPILFDTAGISVGATGYQFTHMIPTDLDGDGDEDVVTANALGQLTAWENDGTPFATGWSSTLMGRRARASAMAVDDFDGDGDVDVASGYRWNTDLLIWENDGSPFDGSWTSWQIGSAQANIGALTTADIDGNGQIDIISGGGPSADVDAPSANNRITVWFNAPLDSTWSAVDVGEAYYSVRDLVVGDLDQDGDNDIVFGTNHAPALGSSDAPVPQSEWADVYQVRAYRQDNPTSWTHFNVGRDPEFETLSVLYHGFWGAHVSAVTLADLDNDNDLDIVASEHMEGDFQLLAYENDGSPFDGNLWRGAAIAYPESRFHNWLAANIMDVTAGDFDLDGDVDLASISNQTETHQLIVWENLDALVWEDWSTMTLDPARVGNYSSGWLRHDIATLGVNMMSIGTADLDQDGDLDLLSAAALATEPDALKVWQNEVLTLEPTATANATATSTPTATATPTPSGDLPPTVGVFAPNNGSGSLGEAQTFTTTYADANGWEDLRLANFLMNVGLQGEGLSAAYYRDRNRLYLSNDAGNGWVGWCAPGDAQLLSNGYVTLNCAETAVSGSDNTMTIQWRITPLAAFSDIVGTYQVYLRAMDMGGMRTSWTAVGTWTLTDDSVTATPTSAPPPTATATATSIPGGNTAPTNGTFAPDGGSGSIDQVQTFTTTYIDADGWTDLRRVNFLMNVGLQGNGLSAAYYQTSNRLYLANDAGNGWVGWCTPGADQTLANSYVRLDCATSSANGSAETLTISWNITPLAPFSGTYGTYQVYLRALDLSGELSPWSVVGTWTLLD